MKKWVKINSKWNLRPIINGLEFITYDKNVHLKFPKNKKKQMEELYLILEGKKAYSAKENEENINVLNLLHKRKIVNFSNSQSVLKSNTMEETLCSLRNRVVGRSGFIKKIYKLDPKKSKYKPINTTLFSAKFVSRRGSRRRVEWTSGIDKDPVIAELKAIMEGVERFYSGVLPKEKIFESKLIDINNLLFDSTQLVFYLKKQYRKNLIIRPFSERRKYFWNKATIFPGEKTTFVPIDLIYYPIEKKYAPNPLTVANSNGVASGFSYNDALMRGLYEVIERDAFMIVWLNRLSLPKIDLKSLSRSFQLRVHRIESLGLKVHLIDITLDTIPIIMAIAENKNNPVILLGAAANLNIQRSIDKALSEIEQAVYWEYRDDSKPPKVNNPQAVKKVKHHSSLFRNIKFAKEAEFLWQGTTQILKKKNTDNKKSLKDLVEILISKNNKIIVVDMSPKDLSELGVVVLRSYILGFVPISFGYGLEPLGFDRIKKVPQDLKLKINPWTSFPPLPHPFP